MDRDPSTSGTSNVGAGHRDGAGGVDLEPGADQRALERGGAVGVADEPVGDHEREAIDGARRRDAVSHLAGAAEILDRGLRAGVEDLDHEITGR